MRFDNLVNHLSPFLLDEKYHAYDIPTVSTQNFGGANELPKADTNKYLMYDFYVLDYLKFLVDNMSPKQFRDLNPDLEDSVQDAVKKLFPHLRKELLDAVFYAMCAEFRNSTQVANSANLLKLPKGSKERKLYADWLKYMKIHRGAYPADELETLGVKKPSSNKRVPQSEKQNTPDRNVSYKAANYSMEQNGASKKEFVEMMDKVFRDGMWNASYGGPAWAGISEGWLTLLESDQITPRTKQGVDSLKKPMSVAIDHVYDLQHNTDTVFNKLKSYYSSRSGYKWIKDALDDKANVKSYHDLLENTSGTVKSMAMPVLYNRLGTSWEEHMRKTRPDDLYNPEEERKKQEDADKIKAEKEANLQITLQKLKDNNTVLEDDEPLPTPTGEKEHSEKGEKSTKIFTNSEMRRLPKVEQYNTNVGDKVVAYYNSGMDKYLTTGKVYEVKRINHAVLTIEDNMGIPHKYGNFRFKKYPEKENKGALPKKHNIPDLQIGDLVHRKGNFNLKGKVIDVIIGPDGQPGVEVKTKEGNTFLWKVRNTVKVDVGEHPDLTNSKVGDMVLCIDDEHARDLITNGKQYELTKITPDKFVQVIANSGANSMTFANDRFEVIYQKKTPDSPESKYKVGDRVIYTTDEPKVYNGTVKEVKSVPHNPVALLKIYFKELQDDINIQDSDRMLRKAPRTFSQKIDDDTPKVGDDVVVIKDGKALYGTLSDLSSSGNKGWIDIPHISGYNLSSWFPIDKIKKDTSSNHIDNEELKIGDDVTVTSKISHKVFFGILKSIDYKHTEGLVDFPPQNGTGQHAEWFPLSQIEKDTKI